MSTAPLAKHVFLCISFEVRGWTGRKIAEQRALVSPILLLVERSRVSPCSPRGIIHTLSLSSLSLPRALSAQSYSWFSGKAELPVFEFVASRATLGVGSALPATPPQPGRRVRRVAPRALKVSGSRARRGACHRASAACSGLSWKWSQYPSRSLRSSAATPARCPWPRRPPPP